MFFYLDYFFRNDGLRFIQTAENATSMMNVALVPPLNNIFTGKEYTNAMFPHLVYVPYTAGEIVCTKVNPDISIFLSSKFTGCAMAYFEHKEYGEFVAHISLGLTGDTRAAWNAFIRREKNKITKYRIFKPLRHNSGMCHVFEGMYRNRIPTSCIGMISPDFECFSILVTDTKTSSFDINTPIMTEKIRPAFYHGSDFLYLESSIDRFLIPANAGSIEW